MAGAVPAIASGEFTTARHRCAARVARRVSGKAQTAFALTPAGARLIGWKVANALDWLAQAAANRHEHEQAGPCAGTPPRVRRLRPRRGRGPVPGKAFDALQARIPDADERLRRLNSLDTLEPRTLARAGARRDRSSRLTIATRTRGGT